MYTLDFPQTGQGFIQDDIRRLKNKIDEIKNNPEDGLISGGDGIVSADFARGFKNHQNLLNTRLRSEFAPDAMPVFHVGMYNNPYFKEDLEKCLKKHV